MMCFHCLLEIGSWSRTGPQDLIRIEIQGKNCPLYTNISRRGPSGQVQTCRSIRYSYHWMLQVENYMSCKTATCKWNDEGCSMNLADRLIVCLFALQQAWERRDFTIETKLNLVWAQAVWWIVPSTSTHVQHAPRKKARRSMTSRDNLMQVDATWIFFFVFLLALALIGFPWISFWCWPGVWTQVPSARSSVQFVLHLPQYILSRHGTLTLTGIIDSCPVIAAALCHCCISLCPKSMWTGVTSKNGTGIAAGNCGHGLY